MICSVNFVRNTTTFLAVVGSTGQLHASSTPTPTFKLVDASNDTGINRLPAVGPGDPAPDPFLIYEMPRGPNGGATAADYDGDGDIDLFIPNGQEDHTAGASSPQRPDLLYINNTFHPNGTVGTPDFSVIDFSTLLVAGPGAGQPKPKSVAAIWLDYDGDRLLDLFVLGDCLSCAELNSATSAADFNLNEPTLAKWVTPRLYRQRHDGTFEDASVAAGLDQFDILTDLFESVPVNGGVTASRTVGGISAGDINGDGYPEIFIGYFNGDGLSNQFAETRNGRLLMNTTGLSGREYSEAPGGSLTTPILSPTGQTVDDGILIGSLWQSLFVDIDGDKDLDILVAADGTPNLLWINDTKNTITLDLEYKDTVALGMPSDGNDMGLSAGDYDNDGDFDFSSTDITGGFDPGRNDLIRNNLSVGVFGLVGSLPQVSTAAGIVDPFSWNWGTSFADLDNNGWQDLLITNWGFTGDSSHVFMNASSSANPAIPTDPGRLFDDELFPLLNPLDPADPFIDAAYPDSHDASSLIAFDYDRDGDLDLVQTTKRNAAGPTILPNIYLYENQPSGIGSSGYSLTVKPRGAGKNTHGIGAKVRVDVDHLVGDDLAMSRPITAGMSTLGHEPAEAHFGLGNIVSTDTITITVEWLGSTTPSTVVVKTGAEIIANSGTIDGNTVRVGWCSYADVAAPFGTLDVNDTNEFLKLFAADDPRADLAAPYGTIDFFDISAFTNLISEGCNLK